MYTATLSSKNQVTIPKKLLDLYGLKSGDKIKFTKQKGKIIVEPAGDIDIDKMAGSLTSYVKPELLGKSWGYVMDKANETRLKEYKKRYGKSSY